mgnify:CR=1 FL=1
MLSLLEANNLSPADIDLIGFHGQTIFHDPANRITVQIGDGALMAELTGIDTVAEFRHADVAAGGEGAPFAPLYHRALAKELEGPLAVLNLGGVGNVTYIDGETVLAFDTGPANAPLDDLMRARRGLARDENGALALSGIADEAVVKAALQRPFMSRMPPKSLDRSDFNDLLARVAELSDADAAATLVAITVACVADGLSLCPARPAGVLVCGGGRHNAAMMQGLAAALSCPVAPVEDVGLDGDMLEAQAFAFLAVRVVRKMSTSGPMTTGVAAQVGGGRISRPRVHGMERDR